MGSSSGGVLVVLIPENAVDNTDVIFLVHNVTGGVNILIPWTNFLVLNLYFCIQNLI